MTIYRGLSSVASRYRNNFRLFSRNAWLFLLGTFFTGMGLSGFMLLFNLYLKSAGFAEGRIGNIITAATWGTLIMAIPASAVIRRSSIKLILIITIPIILLTRVLQISTLSYQLIIYSGLIAGLVSVFSQVASAPFFMRNSTAQERPYLFSMNFAFGLVAGILGSIMGGFLPGMIEKAGLIPYLTYRYTMYIFAGMVLVALIPYFMIREEPIAGPVERLKFSAHWQIITKLFLPNFVTGIGAGLSIPFINLYFKDVFSASTRSIGIFYGLQQVLMITGLLIAPVIAEKIGKIRTIALSQLISIPFLVIMGITHNLGFAVVAFLIRGTMMNMAQPLFSNYAMERVKHNEQPFTNALLVIAWTAGWGASASIGGLLIEHYSYGLPFFTTSLLYLVSTILIFLFFKHE